MHMDRFFVDDDDDDDDDDEIGHAPEMGMSMAPRGSADEEQAKPKFSIRCQICCHVCCSGFGRILTFVISHIGLMALVVGYCVLGGLVFERLESGNELKVKDEMVVQRHQVTEDIWGITEASEVLDPKDWMTKVTNRMKKFEGDLIKAMRKDGWNGHEDHSQRQWTLTGSLFYSIICITTIGYGDQTPKTSSGKLVTMFYAIFGMPLMWLCLAKTGKVMATCFRFLYWRVCCFLCVTTRSNSSLSRRRRQLLIRGRSSRSLYHDSASVATTSFSPVRSHPPIMGPSLAARRSYSVRCNNYTGPQAQPWTHSERASMRRSLRLPRSHSLRLSQAHNFTGSMGEVNGGAYGATNTSPGPGIGPAFVIEDEDITGAEADIAFKDDNGVNDNFLEAKLNNIDREDEKRDSKKSEKSVKSNKSLSLNIPQHKGHISSTDSSPRPSYSHLRCSPRSVGSSFRSSVRLPPAPMTPAPHEEDLIEYPVMLEEEFYDDDYKTKEVPLWICGILVLGYVLGGSFLFSGWEKWALLDSAYFCFITLTTIGFGDFVPKTNRNNAEVSIAFCSIYLLFGMSLLVMTFNLVQEQVVNKVRGVAQKLGIVKDDYDLD